MVVQAGSCSSQCPLPCLVHTGPSINTCKMKEDLVVRLAHLPEGSLPPWQGLWPQQVAHLHIVLSHCGDFPSNTFMEALMSDQPPCSVSGPFFLLPNPSLRLVSDLGLLTGKQPSELFQWGLNEVSGVSPQCGVRSPGSSVTRRPFLSANLQKNPEARVMFLHTPDSLGVFRDSFLGWKPLPRPMRKCTVKGTHTSCVPTKWGTGPRGLSPQ